jgi:putative transport protein
MRDLITGFLGQSPIVTLSVIIDSGYLLGEVSIFGFRLGVAGVLFAGLTLGALFPELTLPEILSIFGLVLFVYTMGLQSGTGFFVNLRRQGWRNNQLTFATLFWGTALLLMVSAWTGIGGAKSAGLYTGALTNTPALAAVIQQAGSPVPAETYSLAYPMGVMGVLLCFQIGMRLWKPKIQPAEEGREITARNFVVKNPGIAGKTLREIIELYPDPGFQVSRIQHNDVTAVAGPDTQLALNDLLVVVGDEQGLQRALAIFGGTTEAHIELDRSRIDYRRMFVSNKNIVGVPIGALEQLANLGGTITRIKRGDTDFIPAPDTTLQFGDRVRVVADKDNFVAVAKLLGDSIGGTAEINFVALGIGVVLGVVVGVMAIPIPGFGTFQLGLAGGPLLVALVLGYLQKTGPFLWTIPLSANLTVRQIGLALFMAVVGLEAGPGFVKTFHQNGLPLMAAGALVTIGTCAFALVVGYYFLKIPYDELIGITAGIHTESAAVAYASNLTRTERPESGFASVYPVALIIKVIVAQLLARSAG